MDISGDTVNALVVSAIVAGFQLVLSLIKGFCLARWRRKKTEKRTSLPSLLTVLAFTLESVTGLFLTIYTSVQAFRPREASTELTLLAVRIATVSLVLTVTLAVVLEGIRIYALFTNKPTATAGVGPSTVATEGDEQVDEEAYEAGRQEYATATPMQETYKSVDEEYNGDNDNGMKLAATAIQGAEQRGDEVVYEAGLQDDGTATTMQEMYEYEGYNNDNDGENPANTTTATTQQQRLTVVTVAPPVQAKDTAAAAVSAPSDISERSSDDRTTRRVLYGVATALSVVVLLVSLFVEVGRRKDDGIANSTRAFILTALGFVTVEVLVLFALAIILGRVYSPLLLRSRVVVSLLVLLTHVAFSAGVLIVRGNGHDSSSTDMNDSNSSSTDDDDATVQTGPGFDVHVTLAVFVLAVAHGLCVASRFCLQTPRNRSALTADQAVFVETVAMSTAPSLVVVVLTWVSTQQHAGDQAAALVAVSVAVQVLSCTFAVVAHMIM